MSVPSYVVFVADENVCVVKSEKNFLSEKRWKVNVHRRLEEEALSSQRVTLQLRHRAIEEKFVCFLC